MLRLRIRSSRAAFQEKTNPLSSVAKDTANIPLACGLLLFGRLLYKNKGRNEHVSVSQKIPLSFWVVKLNIKEKGWPADGILSTGVTLLLCLRPSVSDAMKVQTFAVPSSLGLSPAGIKNCLNSCACASDHNAQRGGCFTHHHAGVVRINPTKFMRCSCETGR